MRVIRTYREGRKEWRAAVFWGCLLNQVARGGCWGEEMKRAMSLGGVPQDASEVRNVVHCIVGCTVSPLYLWMWNLQIRRADCLRCTMPFYICHCYPRRPLEPVFSRYWEMTVYNFLKVLVLYESQSIISKIFQKVRNCIAHEKMMARGSPAWALPYLTFRRRIFFLTFPTRIPSLSRVLH